jgi:hypothetical protein
VQSTFPALGYLAEVTSGDATQHLRVAKARSKYEESIAGISERNEVRRIVRDLREKEEPLAVEPSRNSELGGRRSRES